MNQTVTDMKPAKAKATSHTVGFNQGIVSGRIKTTRKDKTKEGVIVFYTVLLTPAADEFSHPGTLEVSSDDSLGKRDDDVVVKVVLTGYARTWEKQNGPNPTDTETIPTATNYLRVIEQIS